MKDQVVSPAESAALGIDDSTWLSLATEMADVGRWIYHASTDTCRIDEALERLTGLEVSGTFPAGHFFNRIHEDDRPLVRERLTSAVENLSDFEISFRFCKETGEVVWFAGRGRTRVDADGSKVVIGVTYDVTRLQNAVTANRLLATEMAHRVKNVISLVSGIYRMAARGSANVDELSASFLGRLETLNSLNDLIFDGETRTVHLEDVFARVFGTLGVDQRVSVTLADFALNGTAAQTVVLAINELTTNAVKYGALSTEDGRLDVRIAVDAGDDTFDLVWVETVPEGIGGPPAEVGFGMTVLNRMTRHTFNGAPEFEWREDGLTFSCRWSAAEMAARSGLAAEEERLFEEAARATAAVDRKD